MKRLTGLFLTIPIFWIMGCESSDVTNASHIQTEFEQVPETVKPWAYWYWMNDNVSKQGITDDLESMAEIGIKEVFIGNIGEVDIPSGDVRMLSEEWWELMRWSIREGHRTGVDIGVFNSPGWSQSGGPWVTSDKAMRYLVSSETELRGPARFNGLLPAPIDPFQDVAVLAIPVSSDEVYLSEKEHRVWTRPAIQNPQVLTDGKRETEGLFPDLQTSNNSITIEIETAEPFTTRSLVLHPAEYQILADCELYAEIDEEFQLVRAFELDRHNEYLPVGPVPYAELAISFPEVSSDRFRLVITLKESAYFIAPAGYLESEVGGLKEIELSSGVRLEHYMEKQLAKLHQDPVYSGTEYIWESQPEPEKDGLIVGETEVINLTDRLSEDGRLDWEVPEGRWVIQRIGMTPTGVENHPALPHARGLEIDKMDPEAIRYHFDQHVGKLKEGMSEEELTALKHVIIDSYEVGSQNWTDRLEERFLEVYGYDPLPWLSVLSGRVVGSVSQSDRFLWDLRRLVADEIAINYVGGLKKVANESGMELWLENYGHWGFPSESLFYGGQSDCIGGEFWNEGPLGSWECKIASSTGHIYGKKVISAESFTTSGLGFQRSPQSYKKRGDWSYTEGINHTVLTLFIHQPYNDKKPGVDAWFGSEINRHNTWWDLAKPWIDYQRRCTYLLQQGLYKADVCYFIGEDAPKSNAGRHPELPAGYSFDYINYDVLMNRMDVEDGRFILPDGMSYRILVLPESKTMRPELLEKISQLVEKGGVILGSPPSKAPGKKDYPQSDQKVASLAKALWGDLDGEGLTRRDFGKGMVFRNCALEEIFETLELPADFSVPVDLSLLWIHRTLPGMDIYFLTNQGEEELSFTGNFRVSGMHPQWWNAIDGSARTLPEYNQQGEVTKVPIRLGPLESGFVVFTKQKGEARAASNFPVIEKVKEISGPWDVIFTDPFAETFSTRFEKLEDWSQSSDDRIRYFSGTAVYQTEMEMEESMKGKDIWLNLGDVQAIAKVCVNGEEAGIVWTAPWRVNVSEFLTVGSNTLEIEVANTWLNRLKGDALLDQDKRKSWMALDVVNPADPLQTSGLLGPVNIEIKSNL
jgi:hypothetical protein